MNFFEPKALSDVVGNRLALNTLRAILDKKGMAPRIYIFEGPSGVGKTAIAKFFLKELSGESPKKFNIEAYANIPDWEDLGESPVLFEEAVRIPKDSWDHICKIADSSKPHPYLVFTTTDYFKLPQQIKSRAFRVQLSKLSTEEAIGFMSKICAEHDIPYELSALQTLSKLTKGVPKEAIKALHLLSLSGPITNDAVASMAPVELESGCYAILNRLIPDFQGALTALEKLDLFYSSHDIINGLFTAYSFALFNRATSPLYEGICCNLSNYKKISDIFLKWKSALAIPSECLPLLLKELSESNLDTYSSTSTTPAVATTPAPRKPVVREIGVSEFARLCNAEIVE